MRKAHGSHLSVCHGNRLAHAFALRHHLRMDRCRRKVEGQNLTGKIRLKHRRYIARKLLFAGTIIQPGNAEHQLGSTHCRQP